MDNYRIGDLKLSKELKEGSDRKGLGIGLGLGSDRRSEPDRQSEPNTVHYLYMHTSHKVFAANTSSITDVNIMTHPR